MHGSARVGPRTVTAHRPRPRLRRFRAVLRGARRNRAGQERAQAIRDACKTSAPADQSPPVGAEHDMDAVPPQPRPLIEAVLRRAGSTHCRDRLDERTFGRRATERQLQQHGLAEAKLPEPTYLCRDTKLESRATRRPGDDERCPLGRVDVGQQHASIERDKPRASPPPADERDRCEQEHRSHSPSRQSSCRCEQHGRG